jgi:hypothetical protein
MMTFDARLIVPELFESRRRAGAQCRRGAFMTSEDNRKGNRASRPRPTRAQRIVAAGFLGAFGLTVLTVLLTGLWVRAPRTRAGVEPPPPAVAVEPTEVAPSAAPAQLPQPDTAAAEVESAAGADEPRERSSADAAAERAEPHGP